MLVVAVDFDGTIVENAYPLIGKLKPHAKEVINFLHKKGHKILIWTCRGRICEQEAIDFLEVNGIHYDFCNNNLPETVVKFGFETRKLSYDVLIDDRNLNGFVEWNKVIDSLKRQFPEERENLSYHKHEDVYKFKSCEEIIALQEYGVRIF